MPSRSADLFFDENLKAIQRICGFIGSMGFAESDQDEKTASAVERQLLTVTEASVRLSEEDRELCPGVEWRDMRNLGNRLRHAYHDIDNDQIWNIVHEDLPDLRARVERTLREHFPDSAQS